MSYDNNHQLKLAAASVIFFPVSRFNQCFGVFGVLDRLHGTDTKFRGTKQYERHTLLTSLTPLNESIPDTPKKGQWWPATTWPLTSGRRLRLGSAPDPS